MSFETSKISIITYVKNGSSYIKRCIESVLSQSLENFEYLIVDGGSTDGTLEIIRSYAQKDSRIRILYAEGSVGKQFNYALKQAKSNYIGIVESDDYIPIEMYQEEYNICKAYDLDMLKADFFRFCTISNEELKLHVNLSMNEGLYGRVLNEMDRKAYLRAGVYGIWSGLYRRDFLLDSNIFMNETPGASYQDVSFQFLATVYAKKFMFLHDAYYHYRVDNASSSMRSPSVVEKALTEYMMLKERLIQSGKWEEYKEIWLNACLNFCVHCGLELKQTSYYNKAVELSKKIEQEIIEGKFTYSELSPKNKEYVDLILRGDDGLASKIKEETEKWNYNLEGLKALNKQSKAYIFGAGNLGELVMKYLSLRGLSIVAFVDNDSKKWGNMLNEKEIISPNNLKVNDESTVIICNETHGKDILEQLKKMGIHEKRILLINRYESIIREIVEQ